MRLFIGIDLTKAMKSELFKIGSTLKTHTQGNLTRLDNYHLTLAFLGKLDTTQTDQLIACLNTLAYPNFTMSCSELSYFQKGESYIYFMGIQTNSALKGLYEAVIEAISPIHLSIHGHFQPHITLIRQGKSFPMHVLNIPSPQEIIHVSQVTLFQSHTLDQELTYTPLHRVVLL